MYHAITTFPGAIVLFAGSLRPDMTRLALLLETTGSRGIVIAENNEMAGDLSAAGISRRGFSQRNRAVAGGVRAARRGRRHLAAAPADACRTRPKRIWWARACATG